MPYSTKHTEGMQTPMAYTGQVYAYLGHFGGAEVLREGHNRVLKAADRQALPDKAFALPGRRYPIPDRAHAANALARASQHATPKEQATIKRKVARRYPGLGKE